jgi:hypothetical protein
MFKQFKFANQRCNHYKTKSDFAAGICLILKARPHLLIPSNTTVHSIL